MDKNRSKGITLIALVVTIIVLLLLAGISVQMLTGDNGILQRAGEAKKKTETVGLKEEAQIAVLNRKIEKTTTGTNLKTFKEELENEINRAIIEEINKTEETEGLTDVYYAYRDGNYVTIYEDGEVIEGKVEIWDGKKVSCPEFKKNGEVWNWYIYTPSQLKFLADFVNNGKSLTTDLERIVLDAGYTDLSTISLVQNKTYVYIMNDLDFGAREGNGDTKEERWENDRNSQVQWTPIGSEFSGTNDLKAFPCIFEGNNHTISGIYVNNLENGGGLFGGYALAVWDISIKNSYIKGKQIIGGIAVSHMGVFKNNDIINSIIISTDGVAGGIVAASWGNIINCNNKNTCIYGVNAVGGIVGQKNTDSKRIENCSSSGNIIGNSGVGGIVGNSMNNITTSIINCINTGNVEGRTNVGGIIGIGKVSISDTINNGRVKGREKIGGITGELLSPSMLNNCINNGEILGKTNIDGLVGVYSQNDTITDCVNNGKISIVED